MTRRVTLVHCPDCCVRACVCLSLSLCLSSLCRRDSACSQTHAAFFVSYCFLFKILLTCCGQQLRLVACALGALLAIVRLAVRAVEGVGEFAEAMSDAALGLAWVSGKAAAMRGDATDQPTNQNS